MQLGSVCSRFAEACCLLLTRYKGLQFVLFEEDMNGYDSIRLDSALLLHWGSHANAVSLGGLAFDLPGLEAFLGTASKARMWSITTHGALSAAKADLVLSKCTTALRELEISCVIPPCFIPSTVGILRVELQDPRRDEDEEDDLGPAESNWDDTQADALLFRLAQLPALQTLYLKFTLESVQLTSAKPIAGLERLDITLRLQTLKVDLNWVRVQPCRYLRVNIMVSEWYPRRHRLFVAELKGLQLTFLALELWAEWDARLQKLWSRLSTTNLSIDAELAGLNGTRAVPVQALPSCENAIIYATRDREDQPDFYISWSALTGQIANIVIMAAHLNLHVLHANMASILAMQQPWQLTVWEASSIAGLPAPGSSDKLWQCWNNAAARAAGWRGSTSKDWVNAHEHSI